MSENSRKNVIKDIKIAGIINVCYCLEQPELPLKGNYNPENHRIYFRDTGLLIGSLDEEAQEDLRNNKNFNTYKGISFISIKMKKVQLRWISLSETQIR